MKKLDLTGQQYGKPTVLCPAPKKGKHTCWVCRCECGNETVVSTDNLRSGHTSSCGRCRKFIDEGGFWRCITPGGKSFLFDKDDFDIVKAHAWYVDRDGYVRCPASKSEKARKLHRVLLGEPSGIIDHINGDRADNRRCNLRITDAFGNAQNQIKPCNNTSGYKGVSFEKETGKYKASISCNHKLKNLGRFKDPIEAAMAYDQAAFLYFGEFARPNFRKEEKENGQTEDQQVLAVENRGAYKRSGRSPAGTHAIPERRDCQRILV